MERCAVDIRRSPPRPGRAAKVRAAKGWAAKGRAPWWRPRLGIAAVVVAWAALSVSAAAAQPPVPGTVPAPAAAPPSAAVDAPALPSLPPRLMPGNDAILTPGAKRSVPESFNQPVKFNYEQAPTRQVVHAVLGDLLGLNYVVHGQLPGTITVSTASALPADRALSVLETALQSNGVLIVVDAQGVYNVGAPEALRGVVPLVNRVEQGVLAPGYSPVIIPLRYIGASEMVDILKPLTRAESILRVDTLRNILVMAGTRSQIEGWLDLVKTFDVDLLRGMSIGVFPLQYVSVRDIETALQALTGEAASAPPAAPAGAGGGAAAPPAPAAAGGRPPFWGALRVIPLQRLNSIFVVTPRAAYLDDFRRWLERLDRPAVGDGEPRLFVYSVRYSTASHLAGLLGVLLADDSANATLDTARAIGAASGGGRVAPSLETITGGNAAASSAVPGMAPLSAIGAGAAIGAAAGAAARTTSGRDTGATAPVQLGTGVRVVGDERANAVLVYAPPHQYRKIEDALRRLDQPQSQVLIDATIAEVTLSDDLQYGLEWAFSNTRGSYTGDGVLNLNQQSGIRPLQPGFSYTLTNSLGQIRVVLNALAERSLIRVISSPSVMVLDNQVASIIVGNQQPIRSGETVTTGGNVTTSIQYRDTGVQLSVVPTINDGNRVSLNVAQSVVDVGPIDVATGQRSFLQRQVTSRVTVKSGEALVLGGLIRDNVTTGSSGIPYLSRIPVLGALFGRQVQAQTRTELLVVITPRVVGADQDVRPIVESIRREMESFDGFTAEQKRQLPPAAREAPPLPPPPTVPAAAR